jgi:ring-1,2-phenylacetyl-CoA epoxidase subunit PaaE
MSLTTEQPAATGPRLHAFHRLTVADIRRETDDTVSVSFAVPPELAEHYRFLPGQHLTFRTTEDGVEVRRSYSICVGMDDGELRVAVKQVPGGRFSAWANTRLAVGDQVEVMTPSGRFTVTPDPAVARHYLAIAAGSGITPVMSIVRSVLAREPASTVTLVYGNRGVGSIIFRDQLDDLKNVHMQRLQVLHVLSREHRDIELFNGRITAEKVRELAATVLDLDSVDEVYLCGPEPMTMEVRAALLDLGVEPTRLHLELFGTPHVSAATVRPVVAGDARRVTVVLNGVSTGLDVSPADTVLDAALAAGLDLPFSCKGGVCATCRAKVCDGAVEMAVNYALEPWEVDAGFVLTCQSRPVSPAVTVDYDAN